MSVQIKSPNGTINAERRRFADLDRKFRGKPEFCVATIDYGTTHCSVSYTLYPGEKQDPVLVTLDQTKGLNRVPNCILFDDLGHRMAFGYDAREKYLKLDSQKVKKWFYFEHVKKTFQHVKVDRNTTVVADNEVKFFLLDVIAHTLRYLKKKVTSSLGGALRPGQHIDWVVTVPAIWDAAGKQMMREAGYKAGLCSNRHTPEVLRPAQGKNNPFKEAYPDRLSLALEPESAAIQCQLEAKNARKASTCYVVADIGGGTVDIACHQTEAGFTEERHPAIGNDWGGTKVNEKFQNFLEDLVEDDGFSGFVGRQAENQEKHKAIIRKLLYTDFEHEKVRFGEGARGYKENYVLELRPLFWGKYGKTIMERVSQRNRRSDMSVQVDEEEMALIIEGKQMAKFFQPAIEGISNLLLDLLSGAVGKATDTVFFVGGFGGCHYVQLKVQEDIVRRFGTKYKFFTPPQPEHAVARGATAFRCNPQVLRTRKADFTYGVNCVQTFDASIHEPEYKQWSEDQKQYNCSNLFSAFVEVGESVNTHEAFVNEYHPIRYDQTEMTFTVYSSPKKPVWYISDYGVQKLGKITVQMEGVGLDRMVEITFDITHTEIQVRGYQKPKGTEVKTVVDFL